MFLPRSSVVLMLLIAVLVTGACSGTDSGEPGVIELQIGSVSLHDSLIGISANEFVRRINERLEGRVNATFFPSSQLGNDEVMLQKLKLGTLDFSMPSTVMSSMVDEFGLFEMPYLVRDRQHLSRIKEEIIWPVLAPAAEDHGYHVVAVWENGFRHVTNNVRPINTPEDLSGIKLRTPRGQWRVRLFQSFNANPTPMPLSEVFVALQTGVIDGQENPLPQITSNSFEEVQTYLSLTGHVYTPTYLMTGLDHWESFPEDIRNAIQETARGMDEFIYGEAERLNEELMDQLRASGIQINEADRNSFVEASQPIYDEFGQSVAGGSEMIATAIRLANP
jgi:tripartite ATP-independent transporter DctP family solute receptor